MDIYSAFPSNYLKCSDLQGRNCRVVIESVKIESIGDDDRPVAYFQGKQKGLVLNKTNSNVIADMFGGETNGWLGKEITLFPTKVDYQGKRVDAIRVQYFDQRQQGRLAPAQQQPAQQYDDRNPPPHSAAPVNDMNDEVPW